MRNATSNISDTRLSPLKQLKAQSIHMMREVVSDFNNPIMLCTIGKDSSVMLHLAKKAFYPVPAPFKLLHLDTTWKFKDMIKFHEKAVVESSITVGKNQLKLNLAVYIPTVSAARRDAVLGGIPTINDPAHTEFTLQFKLEPFKRAMAQLAPEVWLAAMRREQSPLRQQMDSVAHGPNSTIKVSPLLDWSLEDMQAYLAKHGLPDETRYFDPTKAEAGQE